MLAKGLCYKFAVYRTIVILKEREKKLKAITENLKKKLSAFYFPL